MRWLCRAVPILLLVACGALLLWPRRGQTVPLYAARTGLMCGTCHFDPNGGGPRNEFGFAFARSRHSLTPEDSSSQWHDLAVVNRIGDNVPIYVGINQRFMLIANTTIHSDSLDRLGFFSMEDALHLTIQPHPRLTLVYTRDGFDDGSTTKEAFGLIGGFPAGIYFKGGRIRVPFGLRMDDHTVATRNSFLDFFDQQRFLPYDPRNPDMGYEVGGQQGDFFERIAFTNGGTHPLGIVNTNAQTVTVKVGHNLSWYQGGLSFYDDFHREPDFSTFPPASVGVRSTRWGYYGLTHWGPFAALGEIAAGTDLHQPAPSGGFVPGKVNKLAGFAELDYAPARQWNFRARFDHLMLDRNTNSAIRDASTHERYALEGEYVPVPFAEVRWTVRRIDHRDDALDDENQAYVQLHFSY